MPDPSHVVMLGTSFETRGGIASVLQAYRAAGLFDRWPVDFVATHGEGPALAKAWKALAALGAVLALMLRYRRAVLHVHSASRASFWRKSVFMSLAFLARWPVIFHLHGGGFATFYDAECGRLRRRIVRFFLDHAACIVVVSPRWCAWMNRATRNPRVVSIANPVALPAPSAAREAGLIAFAARCTPQKGIHELLEAAAALKERFPRLHIECAGDGDLEALRARARELGLDGRLMLHGWGGGRRRADLLARASIFVLPSHAEGLPLGLLEAMAAGCPVVATAVGGIPDLVDHGFNGLLVPPNDAAALAEALASLLGNPALAREMGRAARATIAARFSPARSIERLEREYARLGVPRQTPSQPAAPARPQAQPANAGLVAPLLQPRKLQELS